MPSFKISPKHKRNIYKILPFGLLWAAFGILYALMEQGLLGDLSHYPTTGNAREFSSGIIIITIGSAAMGWIIGAIEIYFLNRYFSNYTHIYSKQFNIRSSIL